MSAETAQRLRDEIDYAFGGEQTSYGAGPESIDIGDCLDQLRDLVHKHPEDVEVAKIFCNAITATLNLCVGHDEVIAALGEIEALSERFPSESIIRRELAWGLTISLGHNDAQAPAVQDEVLSRLKRLASAHSTEAFLGDRVVQAITVIFFKKPDDRNREDRLLGTAREWTSHEQWRSERARFLAQCLCKVFHFAQGEEPRSEQILNELRSLLLKDESTKPYLVSALQDRRFMLFKALRERQANQEMRERLVALDLELESLG